MAFRNESAHRRGCPQRRGSHTENNPPNTADINDDHNLLHGEEKLVFADAGYEGIEKRIDVVTNPNATSHVAMRQGKRKALGKTGGDKIPRVLERLKSSVRACVEHPFHYIKNVFGLNQVRYKGLARHTAQLHTLFALANLLITKKKDTLTMPELAP